MKTSPSIRRMHAGFAAAVLLLVAFTGLGCRSSLEVPDLRGLYDEAAKFHDRHRNPVVVIPGILGTRLLHGETGQVVWGAFGGSAVNPKDAADARTFALPMRPGATLAELRDEVVTEGVLERMEVRLAGLPIQLQAYVEILAMLGAGGYRDQTFRGDFRGLVVDYGEGHFTCFQFPYDWRRDNVESAQALYRFLKEKQAFVTEERRQRWGDGSPVRFDVIAHSMGGLVLRYMLRYGDADLPADGSEPPLTWAGAELVDRAVLVATPNAGALGALEQLIEGRRFGPFLPRFEAALVGTLPSLYQLLPRPRHGALLVGGEPVDFLDPAAWRENEWGLADPRQGEILAQLLPHLDPEERRRVAGDHLEKNLRRAKSFHAALDRPATPPPGTRLVLYAGDAEPTDAVASFDTEKHRFEIVKQSQGDGTVLRSSALMDERLAAREFQPELRSPIAWSQVHFLFADHLGLTADPAFSDNVLYLLLESPRGP